MMTVEVNLNFPLAWWHCEQIAVHLFGGHYAKLI